MRQTKKRAARRALAAQVVSRSAYNPTPPHPTAYDSYMIGVIGAYVTNFF